MVFQAEQSSMIRKLLIANRGEIACRIARTARRMGMRTVAVYSDADASALHVAACDEAIRIGPAPPRESYLRGEAIIEAARITGADAVHPGYGFLSENADFAAQCREAGLIFVGPPPSAIRSMGSKSSAKALMEAAGVPLTPGYHGDEQAPEFLFERAVSIGFPVLIKASAGGGGKGMRRVDRTEDFAASLASCKREAAASFKDDRVLIERYVLRPRHIEVQVFADSHGNCVYLFERDCSVQRRHQKVIEEAPAPGMTPERRKQMGDAAVAAARAVGYEGAGTVEFIVDPDGSFYFMEMNTRLQVEHPVTEKITGQDLVEWQLRVAMGERLPLQQDQLSLEGHAFEARVYAEDPLKDFLPSVGKLVFLKTPEESTHVRLDTGVTQGDSITPHYDPMIAKLIVWDESRERALERLLGALTSYAIVGVANNVEFLQRLCTSGPFAAGDVDTGLIERERAHLFPALQPPARHLWLIGALIVAQAEQQLSRSRQDQTARRFSPWNSPTGWRLGASASVNATLQWGEESKVVRVSPRRAEWVLEIDGSPSTVHCSQSDENNFRFNIDGTTVGVRAYLRLPHCHLFVDGIRHTFVVIDPWQFAGDIPVSTGGLRSPMPGKVVSLLVKAGDRLVKGAPMLVLEAMKMEHTIIAPFDGTVTEIRYGVGEQVAEGDELAVFKATDLAA